MRPAETLSPTPLSSVSPISPLKELSRRGFLRASLALAVTGLLPSVGCGQEPDADAQFLAISEVLTGYEASSLDPQLAITYRAALEKQQPQGLSELLARFERGQRPSLTELTSDGTLQSPAARAAADAVLLMWYTGVYDDGSGPRVAAYTDSLAWRSLTYTNPPTTCGGSVGFWSTPRAV